MFRLSMQPAQKHKCKLLGSDMEKGLDEERSVAHSQFADVGEVDEGGFLCSHSHHLRGLHDKLPLLSCHHVGILLSHDVKDAA